MIDCCNWNDIYEIYYRREKERKSRKKERDNQIARNKRRVSYFEANYYYFFHYNSHVMIRIEKKMMMKRSAIDRQKKQNERERENKSKKKKIIGRKWIVIRLNWVGFRVDNIVSCEKGHNLKIHLIRILSFMFFAKIYPKKKICSNLALKFKISSIISLFFVSSLLFFSILN